MKNLLIIICFSIFFLGCAGGGISNYKNASTELGVSEKELREMCKGVTCHFDDLKGRLEVTANDTNTFVALAGNESRTIQYSWVSGSDSIQIDAFHVFLYGSWKFDEYAEIYIDRDMIIKLSGDVRRVVGEYNQYAGDHEQSEIITDYIPLETARKIANADPETVTIRFYGKDGYNDVKLPRKHNLIQVVKIAEKMNKQSLNAGG